LFVVISFFIAVNRSCSSLGWKQSNNSNNLVRQFIVTSEEEEEEEEEADDDDPTAAKNLMNNFGRAISRVKV
jgi:hypothetical protein